MQNKGNKVNSIRRKWKEYGNIERIVQKMEYKWQRMENGREPKINQPKKDRIRRFKKKRRQQGKDIEK